MSDVPQLLQRQAAWQKSRKELSWPDKIRMVETMQGTLHQLKALKRNAEGKLLGGPLCPIRRCSKERDLISCALCLDMKTCVWLGEEGRKNLEKAAALED